MGRRRPVPIAVVCLLVVSAGAGSTAQPSEIQNHAATLSSAVQLSSSDRENLAHGRVVAKILDAGAPSELLFFAGSRINVTPDTFADALRQSARLWLGPKVPRTGSFANPARREDVARIELPRDDVDDLRDCRAGDCALKLSSAEIARILAAIERHGSGWREAVQEEFRRLALERIQAYQRQGLPGIEAYNDHSQPIELALTFTQLLANSSFASPTAAQLAKYLADYPRAPLPSGADEQFYWLLTTQTPRPTLQAVHSTLVLRPAGEALEAVVVSRQIFATHYLNGSLAVTGLVQAAADERYMLYVNRTAADGLGGFFRGLRRFFVERRIRSGGRDAFEELKQRIERWPAQSAPVMQSQM